MMNGSGRRAAFNVSVGFALLFLFALPGSAWTQRDWEWPEKPENLKVLPKEWTGERLRPVMVGFVRALGVRCSHCHVGEEGQPLSTYDFASDENPKKDVARAMLRMLDSINEQLEQVEPSGPNRVNMWCHTCHRGRPRPMTLAEELMEKYDGEGVQSAIAHYGKLRGDFYGRGAYNFTEGSLNRLGYQILGKGDTEGAIAIFELNAEQYPESGNTYDSLAEAYAAAGNIDLAIYFYEKSLKKDPDNKNAAQKLHELRSKDD